MAATSSTADIHIKPEADKTPAHADNVPMGSISPQFNFTTVDTVGNKIGWQQAYRHPGKLINIALTTSKGNGKLEDQALYSTPLADVKSLDADIEMDVPPMGPPDKNGKPQNPREDENVQGERPKTSVTSTPISRTAS